MRLKRERVLPKSCRSQLVFQSQYSTYCLTVTHCRVELKHRCMSTAARLGLLRRSSWHAETHGALRMDSLYGGRTGSLTSGQSAHSDTASFVATDKASPHINHAAQQHQVFEQTHKRSMAETSDVGRIKPSSPCEQGICRFQQIKFIMLS